LTTLVSTAVALAVLADPAVAQDSSIKGELKRIDNELGETVEGANITVVLDGTKIGSAISGADGRWEIPVPGAGTYEVSLDVASLPDGVAPTDPDRMVLPEVAVRSGQNKTVRFNLGPGISSAISDLDRFKDLVVLGLKLGAIISMAAVRLSLIFGVTGLVNFAHGEFVTFGAAIAFFFHVAGSGPGWRLIAAGVPAVLLTAGFAAGQEAVLRVPLRHRRTGPVAILVISIGLSFAVRNLILIILGGVGLFLRYAQAAIAVRAVVDNKDLSESSGIDVNRVIMMAGATASPSPSTPQDPSGSDYWSASRCRPLSEL